MKKNLPLRLASLAQGFTLVELLVVIAIISILAVIGVSVYSGAQGQARDGKRRSEINTIAKSIETAKDLAVSPATYKYDATLAAADFPKGVPADPGGRVYCLKIWTTVGGAVEADPAAWISTTCPAGYTALGTSINSGVATGIDDGSVLSWKLCASPEKSSVVCERSLQ